jgi:hypothetical protein
MTWAEKGPNTAIVPGFFRFAPPVRVVRVTGCCHGLVQPVQRMASDAVGARCPRPGVSKGAPEHGHLAHLHMARATSTIRQGHATRVHGVAPKGTRQDLCRSREDRLFEGGCDLSVLPRVSFKRGGLGAPLVSVRRSRAALHRPARNAPVCHAAPYSTRW